MKRLIAAVVVLVYSLSVSCLAEDWKAEYFELFSVEEFLCRNHSGEFKNYDEEYHWWECMDCGRVTDKGRHSAGRCTDLAHCYDCEAEFSSDRVLHQVYCTDLNHCADCGEVVNNRTLENARHNWKTDYIYEGCWDVCTDCGHGYIDVDLDGGEEFVLVERSFLNKYNICHISSCVNPEVCEFCGQREPDVDVTVGCVLDPACDETSHWVYCYEAGPECVWQTRRYVPSGYDKDGQWVTEHYELFDVREPHTFVDGVCSVCGWRVSQDVALTVTAEPFTGELGNTFTFYFSCEAGTRIAIKDEIGNFMDAVITDDETATWNISPEELGEHVYSFLPSKDYVVGTAVTSGIKVTEQAMTQRLFAQDAIMLGTELRALYDSIFSQTFNEVANSALASIAEEWGTGGLFDDAMYDALVNHDLPGNEEDWTAVRISMMEELLKEMLLIDTSLDKTWLHVAEVVCEGTDFANELVGKGGSVIESTLGALSNIINGENSVFTPDEGALNAADAGLAMYGMVFNYASFFTGVIDLSAQYDVQKEALVLLATEYARCDYTLQMIANYVDNEIIKIACNNVRNELLQALQDEYYGLDKRITEQYVRLCGETFISVGTAVEGKIASYVAQLASKSSMQTLSKVVSGVGEAAGALGQIYAAGTLGGMMTGATGKTVEAKYDLVLWNMLQTEVRHALVDVYTQAYDSEGLYQMTKLYLCVCYKTTDAAKRLFEGNNESLFMQVFQHELAANAGILVKVCEAHQVSILNKLDSIEAIYAEYATDNNTVQLPAQTAEPITALIYDDYEYVVLADGTAEIIDYEGDAAALVIPNRLGKHAVTSIGEKAFYANRELTSVIIPEGITTIRDGAFLGCNRLANIAIPNSVIYIGDGAFAECTSLASITLPDSVTHMGQLAFSECINLTAVVIPASVTYIGDSAFAGCVELTDVIITDGITHIGAGAFCRCGITDIVIPTSVTSIGAKAFMFSRLANITIPESVVHLGEGAFMLCVDLTSVTIPGSVKTIENDTFMYCHSLATVTISEGVTSIESSAFWECPKLTTVIIPNSVTVIGERTFSTCSSLKTINVSSNAYAAQYCEDNDLSYIYNDLTATNPNYFHYRFFSDGTAVIGAYVGSETDIIIPGKVEHYTVTAIGESAFSGKNITSVTIPDSVTVIGKAAFSDCKRLTSVTISNGVISIEDEAFRNCKKLTSVIIPSSVVSIGNYAFKGCDNLDSVTLCEGITYIGSQAFFDCKKLSRITIPDSVVKIDMQAFARCTCLTDVIISSNVSSIGKYAFYECSNLGSIDVGGNAYAAEYCQDNGLPYTYRPN